MKLLSLYAPGFSLTAASALKANKTPAAYMSWFISGAERPAKTTVSLVSADLIAAACITFVFYLQLLAGIGLIVLHFTLGFTGGLALGAALILGLPFMVVLLTPLAVAAAKGIQAIFRPKALAKALLCNVLEAQVRKLRSKNNFTIIAVVGSVGKTSTKLATAELLKKVGARVRYQEGNYNDRLTVPLVVFGKTLPGLFNIPAWIKILVANNRALRRAYPYDVVVLELGTDGPGQIKQFSYLEPELAIVTAITPEHMEYFKTLDAVAAEELAVAAYADQLLINVADVPGKYLPKLPFMSYGGAHTDHGYSAVGKNLSLHGQELAAYYGGKKLFTRNIAFAGEHGGRIALAAIACADMLEYPHDKIANGLADLKPFAGRMRLFDGIKNTTIIDDTYNASPEAVSAALAVLSAESTATQRIAVLGSMNELGKTSKKAHEEIGKSIDPAKIDLVVTIGKEAEKYLAPAATAARNSVVSFVNPHEAGEYVREYATEGAAILFKGSQNGVFAEEAIKPLLRNKADAKKLVRQSAGWMKKKRKQFKLPL